MRRLLLALIVVLPLAQGLTLRADEKTIRTPWELKIKVHDPKFIEVKTGSKREVFWYVLYELTNNAVFEVMLTPDLVITTDTEKTYRQITNASVCNLIAAKEADLQNSDDLEKDLKALRGEGKYLAFNQITGFKLGAEKTAIGIAVFENIDRYMDKMILHVSGFQSPYIMEKGRVVTRTRHRIQRLYYERPGDEFEVEKDDLKKVKETFIIVDDMKDYRDEWLLDEEQKNPEKEPEKEPEEKPEAE